MGERCERWGRCWDGVRDESGRGMVLFLKRLGLR